MKQINKSKPVLVTGGSGYLASWVIKWLLEDGLTVHTTVRNASNTQKYKHLTDISSKSSGTLKIFTADLLKKGSFNEAMKDCELVMHTASPFLRQGVKDAEQQLIKPALEGTKNVLESANKTPTVKRVVLTSSVVAIAGDAIEVNATENGVLTEANWNTTSSVKHQPYPYSKTLAEKAAWKMEKAQQQWDLVVINPGFILGPSLTSRKDSTSISFIRNLASGKFGKLVPAMSFGVVDVRDVSKAHVLGGFKPSASGRHILVNEVFSILEIANILKKEYPSGFKFPTGTAPKFLLSIVGPFIGMSRKYLKRNVGYRIKYDNSYSIQDLGITYRPMKDTLNDQMKQLIKDKLLSSL